MTPREKAEELINKITETLQDADMYGWYGPACKNCALIAVDEIIKIWEYSDTQEKWWWGKVKQEIEKL